MPNTPELLEACRQKALAAYEDAKGKRPHELDRSLEPVSFRELGQRWQAMTSEGLRELVDQAERGFFDPDHEHFDPVRNRREDYDYERVEVVYGSVAGRDLFGTLFLPARRAAPVPAVVHIHGGGWLAHARDAGVRNALRLTRRGIATLTIDYRLSTEARWPGCLEDSKCAVRFLRAHADTYGIDADHIGAFGNSAGAHLSGMLATAPNVEAFEGCGGHAEQSSAIQAAVPTACNMDIPGLWRYYGKHLSLLLLFGKSYEEAPDLYDQASPIHHVSPSCPPMLLLQGDADFPNCLLGAIDFYERAVSLGAPCELDLVPGGTHGMVGPHRKDTTDYCFDRLAEFFEKHLLTTGEQE